MFVGVQETLLGNIQPINSCLLKISRRYLILFIFSKSLTNVLRNFSTWFNVVNYFLQVKCQVIQFNVNKIFKLCLLLFQFEIPIKSHLCIQLDGNLVCMLPISMQCLYYVRILQSKFETLIKILTESFCYCYT